ncbi:MAG: T9SS type A sorting domain-containing protein, partial [Bacteroidales bacterium]|nr:T9SS type A sorting domain-containing protein [Bacteroidales bacterium]
LKIIEEETNNANEEDFFLSKLYDCDAAIKICLPTDTSLCGESFVIVADSNFIEYFWNGEPGCNELKIDSTGIYTIETIDEHFCISRDTIIVQLNKPPELNLGEPVTVTQGETVTLYATDGMKEYLWSDNSTLSFLNVNTSNKKPGEHIYWVEVVDENECVSEDEVLIEVVENKMMETDEFGNNAGQELIVSIFPNPAKDNITLYIENSDPDHNVKIIITSVKGEKMLQHTYSKNNRFFKEEISLNTLNSGDYNLVVINGNIRRTIKFIKLVN